ncbi:MAG: DUF2490 domain-containing protein [Bacteroidia bacterium]|jgi:hypothetical protein|nr:DUF2490 domain-containing protein [Bacteroidia bacterium]
MKWKVCFWLLGLLPGFLCAQSPRRYDDQFHAWYVIMGNHRLTSKWGLHTEVQLRRAGIISPTQQHLFRVGADYRLRDNIIFTAGYCYVYTGSYGKQPTSLPFNEHRGWQQVLLTHAIGRARFQHRYRLENRWLERYNSTSQRNEVVYVNRFRYRLQLTIPINKVEMTSGTFFAAVNDELWVNFGKQIRFNVFDQNRAYAGFGYQFNAACNVQLGYLNQLIFKSDGIRVENNHTLQLSFFCNLDLRKKDAAQP